MKAVADTSSLIHPAKIPRFWRAIRDTFEEIRIPRAVLDEILKGRHLENSDVPVIEKAVQEGWIKVVNVKKHRTPELPKNLGAGETEAIILILQADEKIDWLLMDDEIATKTARSMGIVVRSASYLPIFWARKGNVKVSEAVGMLDDLVSSGYRLSSQDYVAIKDLIVETG